MRRYRFGKARVADCECDEQLTCRACLSAAAPALPATVEVRQEDGAWSLYVDGRRMIDRESFEVVDAVRIRVLDPTQDDLSEATEVARAIRNGRAAS